MSFSTYDDLKSQIASWLARDDLTDNIPDFITLFEATAARRLRVRLMEEVTTLTPSSGVVALPSDYLQWRSVTWTGDPVTDLSYVHPSLLPPDEAGVPRCFTIQGGNLKVRPSDDTGLEFGYFKRSDALSSSLNWLYTNWPDAYLFGALTEAYLFNKDPDNAAIWKVRRDEVFDEIAKLQFRENGAMAVRVMGQTP